jgi:hypothetical protein
MYTIYTKRDLQISLKEKAKQFDIKKMNELPEFISDYCLQFLSTPETEKEKEKHFEKDIWYHRGPDLRPARFWLNIIDIAWDITWIDKYIPELVKNFEAMTFKHIKEIMPLIYNSLVMPKFSKSSKKLFLKQLAEWYPHFPTWRSEFKGEKLLCLRFVLGSRLL